MAFYKASYAGNGFPFKFVKWIMECISTVSYTFNVNGEMTMPFEGNKRLRQGDPIPPYLFVLCMEYLNRCMMELRSNKEYHYHPRCKKLNITHMCFVDDMLLFARGDVSSVQQLFKTFAKFLKLQDFKQIWLRALCILVELEKVFNKIYLILSL